MTAPTMQDRTVGGTLIYLDYLTKRGYASTAQIDPWKTAMRKVFETVDGDAWESVEWSKIDLDDHMRRFQVLAGDKYRTESIVAYGRRTRNAFDAHEHYLTTGRAPSFRRSSGKAKAKAKEPVARDAVSQRADPLAEAPSIPVRLPQAKGGFELDFPLDAGGVFSMRGPKRLSRRDVQRIAAILGSLEEQPQIAAGSMAA